MITIMTKPGTTILAIEVPHDAANEFKIHIPNTNRWYEEITLLKQKQ